MSKASTHVRISPQKVKIVADLLRNKPIKDAISIVENIRKAASIPLKKLIESASANAKNNNGLNMDNLYVKTINIGDGMTLKRMRPRAKGRGSRILKRSSRIFVIVDEKK